MRLYSEKVPEHMAVVNVSSLTSTAVDLEKGDHLAEGEEVDEFCGFFFICGGGGAKDGE